MSYRLERLSQTFLSPDPTNPPEAGGIFNPSLFKDTASETILFTARGVPVSGYHKGEFRPEVYMSSVMHGELVFDEKTRTFEVTRYSDPWLVPDQPYEKGMGCEDARLTKIGDVYTLPYTACGLEEEKNVRVRMGLATSTDLKIWEKQGVIGPDIPTKAATIFPRGAYGNCGMLFTAWPDSSQSSVMYAEFGSLDELIHSDKKYWNTFLDHYGEQIVVRPPEHARRGAEIGAPPIPTEDGLLLIHCPPNVTNEDRWDIGAMLLDEKNPRVVISSTIDPILEAEAEEEIHAPICKNAVFPMGAVVVGETLLVAHGKGDTHAGLAVGSVNELLGELKKQIN